MTTAKSTIAAGAIATKIKRAIRRFDRMRRKRRNLRSIREFPKNGAAPPEVEPVWPLPRAPGGPADEEIRAGFEGFPCWHYSFAFDGGLSFSPGYRSMVRDPERPLKRFRHFMPWLLDACGGSLAGKRVLDIGCNSGFWSIQCALLGAEEVVGFDARDELVEQASLVRKITGASAAEFRKLDFWEMSPDSLGGRFDVVLNLGVLYHLPKPLAALELTVAMASDVVLLDTGTARSDEPLATFKWEEPATVRSAADAGVVAFPSAAAVELMLRHVQVKESRRIPLRSADMSSDYLTDGRASWIVRV